MQQYTSLLTEFEFICLEGGWHFLEFVYKEGNAQHNHFQNIVKLFNISFNNLALISLNFLNKLLVLANC